MAALAECTHVRVVEATVGSVDELLNVVDFRRARDEVDVEAVLARGTLGEDAGSEALPGTVVPAALGRAALHARPLQAEGMGGTTAAKNALRTPGLRTEGGRFSGQ
jgi:hypothetical protein